MLIDNVRGAWKLATIWVGLVAVFFGSLSHDDQIAVLQFLHIPEHRLPAVLGIAVIVARVIKQSSWWRQVSGGDKAQ